ncbi:MAG TPA: SGNH/GDSL hydrolase family protein [Burkholderiales bacterium]|nr:SGNH/GDSL hydrolase family protein [Burkholderiales bacterium]
MRKFFGILSMAVMGIGTAFVILEVGLRAIGYAEPVWYQPDDQLGWALRPGVRGLYMEEGRSTVRINAAGMRDRFHPVEKPAGTYRVALLGDSYVEAMQVEYRHTFGFLLEDRLQRCGFRPDMNVEVLNFGVRGYGLAQMAKLLEQRAQAYSPDLVLVALSSEAGAPDQGVDRGVHLVHLDPPWREVFWRAADRFRSVQLLYGQYHRMTQAGGVYASTGASSKTDPEAMLQRLKATAALGGAELVVALIHPQPKIEAIGKRARIPMIPLAEAMRREEREAGIHFHGFRNATLGRGHWNELGHHAAADLVAERLCAHALSKAVQGAPKASPGKASPGVH